MNPQKTPNKKSARGGRGGRGGGRGKSRYTRYEDDPDYVFRGKKETTKKINSGKFIPQMGKLFEF